MAGLKTKLADAEQFLVDVVYGRKTDGLGVKLFTLLLYMISIGFSGVVQLRQLLFKNRIIQNHHLGCLVVCVGNLTVGGTGKTPIVEKFARTLASRGRKVAILSRGYCSKKEPVFRKWYRLLTHGEEEPPRIVSDGKQVYLGSWEAGDEPYMLARNLPGVIVLVDKNRVKAGLYAIKKFGVDTLLLDDGFQYLKLKGHTNLLLIDKTEPFGKGHLLPRGLLREPIKHLKRSTYIFLTKSDGTRDLELEEEIRRYKPDAELIECMHAPQHLQRVGPGNERDRLELSSLQGREVAAFSGIAVPESFENLLGKQGAIIKHCERFIDHHRFSQEEIDQFFERAQAAGLDFAVTTEKDAVRLAKDFQPPIPLYYLRLEIEFCGGADAYERALERICFPKKEMRTTRRPFM